jgi:hypothetical protein
MKYLKHIYEMDEPWASPHRLGMYDTRPVTKDNLPKLGDKLRCLLELPEGIKGGGGYKPGRIILVGGVSTDPRPVVWPTGGGSGIYFDALEFIDYI